MFGIQRQSRRAESKAGLIWSEGVKLKDATETRFNAQKIRSVYDSVPPICAEKKKKKRTGVAAGLICSLTTAESSGSSIMQIPQWPLQKALQHHETTRERKREQTQNQKQIHGTGQWEDIPASLKTPWVQLWPIHFTFHPLPGLSPPHSICTSRSCKKCQGDFLVPYRHRKMLCVFCYAKKYLAEEML